MKIYKIEDARNQDQQVRTDVAKKWGGVDASRQGFVLIDPMMAEEMLAYNHPDNRRYREDWVRQIAIDMSNGNFTTNVDAIAFDENGFLVNGQHRLRAIVKSNTAQWCLVIYNAPINRKAMMNIDTHARRTIKESYYMAGDRDPVLQSMFSVGLGFLKLEFGIPRITRAQLRDFIMGNHDLFERTLVATGRRSHKIKMQSVVAVGVMAAIINGEDEEALCSFCRVYAKSDITDMQNFEPKHALDLREYMRGGHGTYKADTLQYVETCIYAYLHKVKRKYVKTWYPISPIVKAEMLSTFMRAETV